MSVNDSAKLFAYLSDRFDRLDQAVATKADAADLQRALGLLDWLTS